MEPVRVEFLMVDGMSARLTSAGRKVDALKGKAREASTAMDGLERASEKVRQTISKLAAAFTAQELVSKIANVRGEFQQLEVAFTTMLGSADKANSLMAQLTETAATTPFGLQEVANGAKQLLAYGTEAEKVNETLVRLGDIAAGLSVPLGDLVYLYGTTMTQGRLYTQDLNQFTGRGIPMIQELAKQFGVAESKVKGLVEEGKVGFPEVQKVIESLTNSGGKFGGLMEAQSRTIAGQINNIEDSIDMMFNKIGQQNEGLINDTLGTVSSLIENYEKVAQEVLALAGAYGTYKAVVITLSAIENARLQLTLAKGAAERTVTAAEAIHFAVTTKLRAAQEALNTTMAKNPYTLVAAAVAALAYGIYKLATYQTDAEKAQQRLDDATKEYNKNVAAEQLQIDGLFARLKNAKKGTQEYEDAKDAIISQYGTYLNGLDAEIRSLNDVEAAYKAVSAAARDAAKARAMETFTKDAADTYATTESDEKEKLYQYLKKYYGNKKDKNGRSTAENRYWELVGVINGNGKVARESFLRQFDVQHHIESDLGAYDYTTNEVRDILNRIKGAKTTYNSSMDEARRRFGDTPEEEEKKKTATTPTTQDYDYWEKKKKEAESQLKALDTSKKGSKEWNKLQEEIRTAQAKMDSYSTSKTDSAAAKQQRQQAKEEKDEQRRAQARTDLGEKEHALELENQEEEIDLMDEGREKKLKQIDKEYQQRAAEIEKKAHDLAEANKKAGETNVNGNGLTAEQQTEIDKANALNEKSKAKQESDLVKADAEAMREYLKQYGTYQQQKLAIAEEYAEKIAKAESEGEKKTLEAERDSALRGVDQKALSQKIDWQTVFGNLTGVVGDQLKETLSQLEAYTKTADFRKSSDTDKQTIYDAIDKLREAIPGGNGTLDFSKLRSQMEALGAAVNRYQQATLGQEQAYAELKSAQDEYKRALAEGTDEEKSAAQSRLAAAQTAATGADDAYNAAATDMQNLGKDYRAASEDTINGLNSVADGLQGFSSGSLQGAFQGLQTTLNGLSKLNIGGKVGDAIGKLSETLSSAGFIGQLISAILSILDVLKDGIGPIISSLIDTILGAVSGILDNILSGDFAVQIGKSLVDGISGIFDALTWGGFSSWLDTSNAKEVQATIDRLTERNELLQTAIEDLTDEIKASKGTKSVAAYKQAYQNQQETNENYLGIAQAQAGYHGSHHSWNYYWGGFSDDQMEWIRQNVRSDFDGDIWSLSPEEMKALRSNVDIWTSIQNTGKGGYGERLTDKLDDYIDQAGKLEELTDELYEGLTGISFDSMYDSFIDNLMDMEYSAKDAAEDISEYFMRAMLSNKIGELYSDKLEDWWKKFGVSMEDGDLSEEERNALSEEYMGYVNEAIALRDSLSKATGYTGDSSGTSQTGKSGSFSAMTQDQGTKLEGMFTSGLQHWSSMDARLEDVGAKMNVAEGHLAKIEENTGVSASHLNEIKEDLKKVIRDGLKVK